MYNLVLDKKFTGPLGKFSPGPVPVKNKISVPVPSRSREKQNFGPGPGPRPGGTGTGTGTGTTLQFPNYRSRIQRLEITTDWYRGKFH
jgi:hypothetical protein